MDTVVAALRHAPELTAKLIERFCALHDPETRDAKRAEALADEIQAAFAGIKSIDEDRILRLFNAVIGATLRTNAFAPAAAEALAFKIDRSEEHTSELQSLMRSSYAGFCMNKTKTRRANHVQTYIN